LQAPGDGWFGFVMQLAADHLEARAIKGKHRSSPVEDCGLPSPGARKIIESYLDRWIWIALTSD
jgi:hypothetical protein